MHHLARLLVPLAFLTTPVALAAPQGFDLIEVSDDVLAPEFPGILHQFKPVGFEPSENGGVAVMDFDNDGLLDVYLPNTEFEPSKLYRNLGGGQFADVAAARGVDELTKRRGGGLFLDVENDGDLDLLTLGYPGYTASQDLFTLFRNDGAPSWSFTNVTASAGSFVLAPTSEPTLLGDLGGFAGGDVNGDGYLDFISTYWARLPGYLYDQMRLFLSAPNPTPATVGQTDWSERIFADATIAAGLDVWFEGSTWMPTLHDYDRDGDLDLHINVDFGEDILRMNDGTGNFAPSIATAIGMNGAPAESRNEMGVALGDVDRDGDLDQFHSNAYWGDRMYRNDTDFTLGEAGLAFDDFAKPAHLDVARFGWGAALTDMDNDGDRDLIRVSGLNKPENNWYHENLFPMTLADGESTRFVDRSGNLPEFQKAQGSGDEDLARSMVPFDYDSDGDLDILVTRPGTSPFISPGLHLRTGFYENTLPATNNWVDVDLRGLNGSRNVANARVHIGAANSSQMHTVLVGSSFMAQEPDRLHFGLGGAPALQYVVVRWADGTHTAQAGGTINAVNTIQRTALDATGDVDFDGDTDKHDLRLLKKAIERPQQYAGLLAGTPYFQLGDIDGNGVLDATDHALLKAMLP
ncbi:MAG: FG-GAP-like repeat-containing protein [Planctomycetota bacterium]|nr:FG-GAP-like repeat-containing protein [Planctomycetota bacterium]